MSFINAANFPGMAPTSLLSLRGSTISRSDPPEDRQEAIAKVCQECEAVFITHLLKQLRQSMLSGELSNHSARSEQYWGLFEQEVSRHLARSGGLGLGSMLFEQLQQERLKSPVSDPGAQ